MYNKYACLVKEQHKITSHFTIVLALKPFQPQYLIALSKYLF